jgi:hypothetical protein
MTTVAAPWRDFINVAYAEVNETMSSGVRLLPGMPPIVPRIPDTDVTSAMAAKVGNAGNRMEVLFSGLSRWTFSLFADA